MIWVLGFGFWVLGLILCSIVGKQRERERRKKKGAQKKKTRRKNGKKKGKRFLSLLTQPIRRPDQPLQLPHNLPLVLAREHAHDTRHRPRVTGPVVRPAHGANDGAAHEIRIPTVVVVVVVAA